MNFREEVIEYIVSRDESHVIQYAEEISKIFKRWYNTVDNVKVFIIQDFIFRPGHSYYKYRSIHVFKSVLPSDRYVIPNYLMYRLQYILAKDYGIIFTERPESYYIDSQYRTTRIRVTKLELNIK